MRALKASAMRPTSYNVRLDVREKPFEFFNLNEKRSFSSYQSVGDIFRNFRAQWVRFFMIVEDSSSRLTTRMIVDNSG